MAEWLSKAVETHVSRQDGNQIIPPDKPEQTPFPLVDTVLYAALLVLGIFGLMLIVALPFG